MTPRKPVASPFLWNAAVAESTPMKGRRFLSRHSRCDQSRRSSDLSRSPAAQCRVRETAQKLFRLARGEAWLKLGQTGHHPERIAETRWLSSPGLPLKSGMVGVRNQANPPSIADAIFLRKKGAKNYGKNNLGTAHKTRGAEHR